MITRQHAALRSALTRRPNAATRLLLRNNATISIDDAGLQSTSSENKIQDMNVPPRRTLYFFLDTVFPIKLGRYDPRYLLAQVEKEQLLERIKTHMPRDTGHGFRVEAVESREKDGGAFVRCSYIPDTEVAEGRADTSLEDLTRQVTTHYDNLAERPWYSWRTSRAHLVKGRPWREDILNRFPSNTLRLEFQDGPELSQEQVYELCRPYGRIKDLEPQAASNKDLPRFANVTFTSIRSAVAARNCLYGYNYVPETSDSASAAPATRLRVLYKERVKGHAFREWAASHPRIIIPLLAVLAGGLSYAIFDPIRAFFVKSHVSGLFDVQAYRLTRWLKKETIGRLGIDGRQILAGLGGRALLGKDGDESEDGDGKVGTGIERERIEAADKLRLWLSDMPDTFITVTGPPGSGKTALVGAVTSDAKNVLTLDCSEIVKAGRSSDSKLVGSLASQLGYFPQFQWASSFNNLIDIASVGLIGSKAGFATALDVQLKQVLDVAAGALKELADGAKASRARSAEEEKQRREMWAHEQGWVENVRKGRVHDGRLDCVASNGVMGELGMGLEKSDDYSEVYGPGSVAKAWQATIIEPADGSGRSLGRASTADIDQIPIVIIKGLDSLSAIASTSGSATSSASASSSAGTPGGHSSKSVELLYASVADWAAALTENRIAHCIFVNDSVAVSKGLARALPSKPFSSISLTDATSENALQYVQKKLKEYGKEDLVQQLNREAIARLGGRLTDLETLIQKMRGGASADEAVDDIITRSATEIVKNCFGEDKEEAKSLPWTREQAWYIVKQLSSHKELGYAELLAAGPFKDAEKALRALEAAEVISVAHRDSSAASASSAVIRPGKPSYRAAFSSLSSNAVFCAQNELALNSAAASSASAAIKSASEELVMLSGLFARDTGRWVFGGGPSVPVEVAARVDECLKKMRKGQEDVERLSNEAKALKEKLKAA